MLGPRHIVTHNNSLADTDHSTESRGRSREGGKSYFTFRLRPGQRHGHLLIHARERQIVCSGHNYQEITNWNLFDDFIHGCLHLFMNQRP